MRVPQLSFLLASAHHFPYMNYNCIFLLLLVVLSAYSESPQYANPPIEVTVYPQFNSAQLGILAPVLPQNEVYLTTPPHFEVSKTILLHNEVYKITPPHIEVFKTIPPHNEVYKIPPPHIEVFKTTLPQNEVYKIALPQNEVKLNKTVLSQTRMFKIDAANCQSSDRVKTIIKFLLNFRVKNFNILTSALIHGGEKLCWTMRILLESFQHVLKMYTWSLSENQASIQFKCRLIGLFLRQSLFKKHDFDVLVYSIYHDDQNVCFRHLIFFSNQKNQFHTPTREGHTEKSTKYQFHGGGKALLFSAYELLPYSSSDLYKEQYQFFYGVKKNQKQGFILNDGDIMRNVPHNILAPKLSLKTIKELANLHDMYMPSKILLKNAQILLENHKCETCEDVFAVFKPYKVASNAERQQTWYQKNKEKCAEYNKN